MSNCEHGEKGAAGQPAMPVGKITPWVWQVAEVMARMHRETDGADSHMVDVVADTRVRLLTALRESVPADNREASILALALLDVTHELKALAGVGSPDRDPRISGYVDVLREGLERIALRIAPTDQRERAVFDAVRVLVSGNPSSITVRHCDFDTGAEVVAGGEGAA